MPVRGCDYGRHLVWLASQGQLTVSDFPITIYHNPACGTSRNTLAIIKAAGYEPTVIEYLQTGWVRAQLNELFAAAKLTPRQAMREKGTPAQELGLLDPSVSDDTILNAMVAHPVLVNRPFVVTAKGTVLSRPSEVVLSVLDKKPSSFTKEDGEIIQI
jgi:arsenate reductase